MQRDDGVQDGETLRENRFDPFEQASQVSSFKEPYFSNFFFLATLLSTVPSSNS